MKRGVLFVAALLCAASLAAAPVKVTRNNKALEFTYAWSAQAAAIPALDRRFRSDLDKSFKDAIANAHDDQVLAKQQKRDFNQHYFSMQWTTAGQTPRLLSLESERGTFEGGAHPLTSYDALLWDRRLNREVQVGDLFLRPSAFAALTRPPYCKALDKERLKRREGEKLDLPEFNACPKYSDLAIAPVDRDKDGRFDAIQFIASPYVAGPYSEGEYVTVLPVTRQLMGALQPGYRPSFEPQRQ